MSLIKLNVWYHTQAIKTLTTSCVEIIGIQVHSREWLENTAWHVKTHRHLSFDNVLHLDMQVLYFKLHAFSSLHCSRAGELWLLQLWETGGKKRTQAWGEGQTLVGQYQRSILDRQGTEGACVLFMLRAQRSELCLLSSISDSNCHMF